MTRSKLETWYLSIQSASDHRLHSPFRFLALPAEIRNIIYKLTATTYRLDGRLGGKRHVDGNRRVHRYISGKGSIAQPGLIRCSRQTRYEGLPIFLRHHRFQFSMAAARRPPLWRTILPNPTPTTEEFFHDVAAWLDRIGTQSCKNIHSMTFTCVLTVDSVPAMNSMHRRLSEEATVVYLPMEHHGAPLRTIQEQFIAHSTVKVPVLCRRKLPHSPTLKFRPGPW